MAGLTRAAARRRLAGVKGVEPKNAFRARVVSALECIVRAHRDRVVVVVVHRGVIDAACCWALGLPDARFAFANASLTS